MRMSAVAVVALTACAGVRLGAEPPDGRALFTTKCALCHGKTGAPPPGFAKKGVRNLSDPEWQKSRSDDEIRKAIRQGRPGTLMASFKEAFSAEEIDALVRHIRRLAPQ